MKSTFRKCMIVFSIATGLCSCQEQIDPVLDILEQNEEFGAGPATVFDESENAFGQIAPNLSPAHNRQFVVGNSFFRRNWVTAPSSTSDLDGLGPMFNARSCGSCHFKDGRGAPPLSPDEDPVGLLFRLSRQSEIEWKQIPDDNYGGQFNPNAIFGLLNEGKVRVSYTEMTGSYEDGTSYGLRIPNYAFTDLNYGDFNLNTNISPRIAPHIIGQGLLEAIPEDVILDWADEFDENGDGISGRPNYVWDRVNNKTSMGRFGWKANQPSVRQQVASAFVGDIGITSSLFPDETCGSNQNDCHENIYSSEIELDEEILDRVTFYTQALAVPKRRNWDDREVLQGKALFNEIGCDDCHKPLVVTGMHQTIPEFSNLTIRPYTDLLLHDMGDGLADRANDNYANGQEWRTPPLWGIGMVSVVNDHTFFLHDGRARNMEEAILWHGGEAQRSNDLFQKLSVSERKSLTAFLESL